MLREVISQDMFIAVEIKQKEFKEMPILGCSNIVMQNARG
jgi:hypothetical protein